MSDPTKSDAQFWLDERNKSQRLFVAAAKRESDLIGQAFGLICYIGNLHRAHDEDRRTMLDATWKADEERKRHQRAAVDRDNERARAEKAERAAKEWEETALRHCERSKVAEEEHDALRVTVAGSMDGPFVMQIPEPPKVTT
jgi:hypothetical protein